jgi:hypothetical protein
VLEINEKNISQEKKWLVSSFSIDAVCHPDADMCFVSIEDNQYIGYHYTLTGSGDLLYTQCVEVIVANHYFPIVW